MMITSWKSCHMQQHLSSGPTVTSGSVPITSTLHRGLLHVSHTPPQPSRNPAVPALMQLQTRLFTPNQIAMLSSASRMLLPDPVLGIPPRVWATSLPYRQRPLPFPRELIARLLTCLETTLSALPQRQTVLLRHLHKCQLNLMTPFPRLSADSTDDTVPT
jgi:hypothetical protein